MPDEDSLFHGVAKAAAETVSDGASVISVRAPQRYRRWVSILFPERADSKRFYEAFDADQDEIREALDELAVVLMAVTTNMGEARFAEAVSEADDEAEQETDPKSLEQRRERERERYALVEQLFDTRSISARSWAKSAAKVKVLGPVEWELLVKHADDDYVPPVYPVPLAQLSIGARSPAGNEHEDDELIVTLDRQDAYLLMKTISRLVDEFTALEGTVEGPKGDDPGQPVDDQKDVHRGS